ncbi:MAG: hypothetical protein ACYS7Y_36465 [Planctomycetota bacterium]|jgi:hypothetical protein
MGKFATPEDVAVGYMELEKTAGKPFKLPKSIDKLPDDSTRADFTAQAHKLLGIEHAANVEALADLDLKAGLADGLEVDETLANSFKEFVVKNKINKASAGKIVGFHNQAMAKARAAMTAQAEAKKLEDAQKTNEALIVHFGSEAKVKEQSELLRRAVKNNVGLTAEEYEEFGEALADGMLTKNPVMARVMLKVLAPLAASSSHEGGGTGEAPAAAKDPDEGSPSYEALGWSKEAKK